MRPITELLKNKFFLFISRSKCVYRTIAETKEQVKTNQFSMVKHKIAFAIPGKK